LDRTEVLEQLEPVLNTQVREVEHNPRTRVIVTPDMVTFRPGGGAHHIEMTKDGVQSMVNFCGLPMTVAGKLRPETFSDVVTQLLYQKHRYSLMVKEGAITAISKPQQYHTVNPERALRAIEAGIPHIDFHRVLILDATTVSLEVLGDRRQAVRRGDLIQAGANITFSPIGTVDPLVQSYVLRLACTNGATDNTIIREFHYGQGGEGDDIWQWFRRSARDAYNSLDRIVERYKEMTSERIRPEDRAMLLEAMLRDAKIIGGDAEAVRAMALERPPETTYEMMNLMTYASSHIIERAPQIRRAQNTGANFAHTHEHRRLCPVCHTHRN